MTARKKIPEAELIEMLNGMAMLVDWHGQLLNAALQLLGQEADEKGRGKVVPRIKPGVKAAVRGK